MPHRVVVVRSLRGDCRQDVLFIGLAKQGHFDVIVHLWSRYEELHLFKVCEIIISGRVHILSNGYAAYQDEVSNTSLCILVAAFAKLVISCRRFQGRDAVRIEDSSILQLQDVFWQRIAQVKI